MSRIIDLTLPLNDGDRGVSITPARRLETDGWNATTLSLYSHCGTHMDAPIHFGVTDRTIDQLPVEKLMGSSWVVNLDPAEPRMLIEPQHLGDAAEKLTYKRWIIVKIHQ